MLRFPAGGVCFGCSATNSAGLGLTFLRDGDGVRCETTVAAKYQGAPDVVHGGIQAVLLDETCCAAAFFTRGCYVVTGELTLRYRRPCRSELPLVITARVKSDEGRFLWIRGAIHEPGDEQPVTIADGKFYRNPSRQSEPEPSS